MSSLFRSLAVAYSAGTVGGIANFAFGILMASLGIFGMVGIHLPSPVLPGALYQRLVWGGLFGVMLFAPIRGGMFSRGFWISLAPSLVAGLIFFPRRGMGYFGLNAGPIMPIVILLFNWVWGIATVWFGTASGFSRG